MAIDSSQYVSECRVPLRAIEDGYPFENIKKRLIHDFLGGLFPEMIGDGLHHVMKFDYYVREECDWPDTYPVKVYRLQCRHSIARVQNVTVADFAPVRFGDYEYKPVCRYCGAEFHPNKYRPGTCASCGAPK